MMQHYLLKLFNTISYSTFTINYPTHNATAFNLLTATATATYKVVKNTINTSITIYKIIKKE